MKKHLISIIKYILVFVLLIALFNGALYLTSSFSSDLIYKNSLKSAEILVEEGRIL